MVPDTINGHITFLISGLVINVVNELPLELVPDPDPVMENISSSREGVSAPVIHSNTLVELCVTLRLRLAFIN